MTPDRARVFYVEDDGDSLNVGREFLEIGGHTVVETATSLKEALEKIPSLNKKGVNVAVVDGNLSENFSDGRDGKRVVGEIKTKHPRIKVVGHSLENSVDGADFNSPKIKGGMNLAETVRKA